MKKIFLLLVFLPLLISCDKEENEPLYLYSAFGTVLNPDSSALFSIVQDDSSVIKIDETNLTDYYPTTGKRILADVELLSEVDNMDYQYTVKLYNAYDVLTKGIFQISEATEDSIGNDPVTIRSIWVGGGYLNVEFVYPGLNTMHYINLISDTSNVFTDGKVHLEFRHNANDDYPEYTKWGLVSFDLSELKSDTVSSVELAVDINEFYYGTRTYYFTYNWSNPADLPMSIKVQNIRAEMK